MIGRPLIYSLAGLSLGIVLSFLLIIPGIPPLFGQDLDDDGISDNFQRIEEIYDNSLGPDGEWSTRTIGYSSSLDMPLLCFVLFSLNLALPVGIYLIAWRRDEVSKDRPRSIERMMMHDTVRRIAAFLEVNPSLISALRYAYISMPESGRRSLGNLLWETRARGNDFNREYNRFKEEWSASDPLVGKALSDLGCAEREPTSMEVSMSARRAMDELTEGSRRSMSAYVQSLQGPATALFGIGVLLPVLLAAMIPISGIGSGSSLYLVGFLLWIAIPAGIVHLGGRIVQRRPRFMVQGQFAREPRMSLSPLSASGFAAGLLLLILTALDAIGAGDLSIPWPGLSTDESTVLSVLWGVSLIGASYINILNRTASARMKHQKEVDRAIPDLLQSIGSSISDGLSFEGALKRSISKGPLDTYRNAILPAPGVAPTPGTMPPQLENAYKASRHFARSGPESGGRAIRALGAHLRGLLSLEDEMAQRISDTMGQMEVTSSVFAPVMIGASVGIFRLLDPDVLSEGIILIGGGASTIASSTFMVLSGVYLLLLSASSSLTISRLRSGDQSGGWENVPRNLMRSVVSFSAGALISIAVIG